MSAGSPAFVTGAGGLLGGWLVRALLDRGTPVTILERPGSASGPLQEAGLRDRCTVAVGDVTDPASVTAALGATGPATVFHLAARSLTGRALADPSGAYEVNVRGTWTVLEAARAAGTVRRVLVASSDRVYVPAGLHPLTEDTPIRAALPYDASKAAADLIARATPGLAVATMRTTNLYGAGDRNGSRLIPSLAAAVIAGRAPVIHSDGTPQRRHLHAADAAAAYLAVADRTGTGEDGDLAGRAFNVGGDELLSVREVTERMLAVAQSDVTPEYRGASVPPSDVDRLDVDTTRLRAATGWAPAVALDDGLRRTLEWYRDRARLPAA